MDGASVCNFLMLHCRWTFKQMVELWNRPRLLATVSLLVFRFTGLLTQQAGNGHFETALCSSHISIIRHLIVLLNRSMTLIVWESSSILCYLHFTPAEKHNKHTLPPFPPCLQPLVVMHVSPLHLLLLHSIAVCSQGTSIHSWLTGKLYHNDVTYFVMWPKEEPSGMLTNRSVLADWSFWKNIALSSLT